VTHGDRTGFAREQGRVSALERRRALQALFTMSLIGACREPEAPTGGQPSRVTSVTLPPQPSASVTTTASASASVVAPPEEDFVGVTNLARAFPSEVTLLGFVDPGPGGKLACSVDPCPPEWTKTPLRDGNRGAVVRRAGAIESVTLGTLASVVGPIDTPEKAALRLRLEGWIRPATCARLDAVKAPCAKGSPADGVPVRKTAEGFEVATFDLRNVCLDGMGMAEVVGVVKVDATGALQRISTPLTVAIDETARQGLECRQMMRGRRFEGYVDGPLERSELEYCERAAHQEAAAAIAFERLAVELDAHGAPPDLVTEARRAADDERRHAELFASEALRLGKALGVGSTDRSREPEAPTSVRPLLAVLLENAREGCANETFAAIVATAQSEVCPAPQLRRALSTIASDEREHALLARRVHAWGRAQLPETERAALDEALTLAVAELAHIETTPHARALGEPELDTVLRAFPVVAGQLDALARAC
jgi:rubrerythrin